MSRANRRRRERPLALERLEERCLLTYTITDLGTLPGGYLSAGQGVNASGEVAGSSTSFAGYHATIYRAGVQTDLGTLGGAASYGYGIGDGGQVVGESLVPTNTYHAFLWESNALTDLGTLGGNSSTAIGVNRTGQAVG